LHYNAPATTNIYPLSLHDALPILQSGSIRDNLLYGVKHRPIVLPNYEGKAAQERKRDQMEAMKSGNVDYDINADWIDYGAMGARSEEHTSELQSLTNLVCRLLLEI